MDTRALTLEFDGHVVTFNIFDAMKYPHDTESVCHISVIDTIVQTELETNMLKDKVEVVLMKSLTTKDALSYSCKETKESIMAFYSTKEETANFVTPFLPLPISSEKLFPSIVRAP
jgi:hypothetical protein